MTSVRDLQEPEYQPRTPLPKDAKPPTTGSAIVPPAESVIQFKTGSKRSADGQDVRYDLITPVGLRRLAETYAEGADKYEDRNWEKGQPATVLVNRAMRHVNLWLSGDGSEDHLAHAAWNLFALMHFEEKMPDMIDIPSRLDDTQ